MTASSKKNISNTTNEPVDHVSLHRRLRRMKRRLLFHCLENTKTNDKDIDRNDKDDTVEQMNKASATSVKSQVNSRNTIPAQRIEKLLSLHMSLPRD